MTPALALATAFALAQAATSHRTLSFAGLGPAKIGMTVREIEHAAEKSVATYRRGMDSALEGSPLSLFRGGHPRWPVFF